MVHIHKKLLSKADILMINRSLSVTVSNDYGPDKNYRLYEMSGDYYQVPLFWAYKNLSAPFDINFNKDIDIKPGKLKAIPRSCQKECMKLCKVELQKPWGGGIINMGTGSGKCLGYNTPIIMFNGTVKMVQDIKTGDFLMGDDSCKRKVLSIARGREEMFEIIPIKGESYIVNKSHILSLKNTISSHKYKNSILVRWYDPESKKNIGKSFHCDKFSIGDVDNFKKELQIKYDVVDINVSDYLNLSKDSKHILKGYRVPLIFPEKILPIDPYMLGYWLGDGHSRIASITSQDSTVLKYFRDTLRDIDLMLNFGGKYTYNIVTNTSKQKTGNCNNCNNKISNTNIFFCDDSCFRLYQRYKQNIFSATLSDLNLIQNKHIPTIYKCNNRINQLKLLAGLIDSDGHLNKNGGFEFCQKNEILMDDVVFLCRSLGFSCYKKIKKTTWTHKGIKKYGTDFRISINGEGIEEIPTKCPRKKSKKRNQKKNVLKYGFKVKKLDVDNYYGFEIDGNHRFVLGDFTVTHNTVTSLMLVEEVKKKTLIVVHTIELLQQWTKSLAQFLPSCRVGYIQGKKFDVDGFDIVIGMLQTISMKCELNAECFSSFGLVIYDEVQFLGAEVFSKALLKSRARYTFGLSATIERADGLEYVFKNHIGDVIYSNINGNLKQYTEMKYVYVNCGLKEIAMYNGSPNIAGMITEMTGDKRRTTQIVNEILHLDVKRNVLVLSDRVQHLKDMYKMIGPEHCGLYIGEMKEDDKLLSKTKRILLATYHIASVGFDLPKLNTLVFATPRSSITQAIGRIYRKVHEDINPMIIDFIDEHSVFPYQFKKRKKIYSKAITLVSSDECCMFE